MIPAIADRIPLVRRPKAPALPLEERIAHLTQLTVAPAGADHHDLVARACGTLNYAALIASDAGMPDLATDLSWRQHQIFAQADDLAGDTAVMSLMPLINIARLLIRDGDGDTAYQLLADLYRAAQKREATVLHGHTVDLSALIHTEADHLRICEELWMTLLVDGGRALARMGHWTEAADAMAEHRGIGHRLLDGRQIKIMSLMEQDLDQQAHDMINATRPMEPWEKVVALLLQACCRPLDTPFPRTDLDHTLTEVATLLAHPDPSTALFQVHSGLAALELDPAGPYSGGLLDAVAQSARADACAAREVLGHAATRTALGGEREDALRAIVAAAGLGAGTLPAHHQESLTSAVAHAEAELTALL